MPVDAAAVRDMHPLFAGIVFGALFLIVVLAWVWPCAPTTDGSVRCSRRTGREPLPVTDSLGIRSALVKRLTIHEDNRGTVRETYRESWFPQIPPIKQLVRSESKPNTLRGMHLHRRQFDIWHIVEGSALVRLFNHAPLDGPYPFLANEFTELSAGHTIAIPPGISHGFYSAPGCILLYGLTEEYDGTDEFGWSPFDGLDPRYPGHRVAAGETGTGWWINWPTGPDRLNISERDLRAPRLADFKG